ncbi:hypothetical protein GWI33_017315 [Rhynchophorus ferrugineus]|uniref:Uncharacterized protein n=1 Tax=Rhynchophorus ferrugineus TaxID=354439 RepID=A0A834HZE6_RHYFE|nr:hypothetical protein GWI33_017315 [Rhynchophorus ferrugineus]
MKRCRWISTGADEEPPERVPFLDRDDCSMISLEWSSKQSNWSRMDIKSRIVYVTICSARFNDDTFLDRVNMINTNKAERETF